MKIYNIIRTKQQGTPLSSIPLISPQSHALIAVLFRMLPSLHNSFCFLPALFPLPPLIVRSILTLLALFLPLFLYPTLTLCVPWQCTAIAVQQYTEQYKKKVVCAHFSSTYVPI
jgi:hypothetical protein